MKRLIPIVLLFYFNSYSQQTSTFCTALESSEFNVQKLSIINNQTIIDNPLTPLVLNVRINVFNFDNGLNYFSSQTPPVPFGEDEFLNTIQSTNFLYQIPEPYFLHLVKQWL